jgi:hypothetical protein
MSEVVERVKRVLAACRDVSSTGVAEIARVSIAAMRKPTEAMEDAGRRAMLSYGAHDCEVSPADIWRAMIDEALK